MPNITTYICGHPIKVGFAAWWHGLTCIGIWRNNWKAASRKSLPDEYTRDCEKGCGCRHDPESPDYWRKKIAWSPNSSLREFIE